MSTNPTLPPMQFVDSDGNLKGMRITLGDEVAKRLCLEPEYIRIEFSAMIPGLQAGRWDVINTGIFWTEERAAMMQMIPYEAQAISISVPSGNPAGIAAPEDLAGKGGRCRDRRFRGSEDQTSGRRATGQGAGTRSMFRPSIISLPLTRLFAPGRPTQR